MRSPATARQELWLATAALGTYNYASIGLFALVPSIRSSLHLSPREVGLLASAQFASAAALTIPAARLTDRVIPGRVVALSQLTVIAAMGIAAAAKTLPVLLLASATLGMASAIVNPVTNVLSIAGIRFRRRALAMSIKQTSVTIAGALAGSSLPATAALLSWRLALVLPVTAASLVAICGLRMTARAAPRPLVLDRKGPSLPRLQIASYGFAMSGVQLAVFGYLSLYLVESRGMSATVAGIGFAVALTGGAFGRLTWGLMSDVLASRGPLLTAIAAGSTAALVALPLAHGFVVWPALLLLGLLSVGWNGVFHTMVAESAGPAGVARATAFAFIFIYAGAIVIPPALGYAVETLSWHSFWWCAAAGPAAATALMALARRYRTIDNIASNPATTVVND